MAFKLLALPHGGLNTATYSISYTNTGEGAGLLVAIVCTNSNQVTQSQLNICYVCTFYNYKYYCMG